MGTDTAAISHTSSSSDSHSPSPTDTTPTKPGLLNTGRLFHPHKQDYDDMMSTSLCTSVTTESTSATPSPCSSITNSDKALSSAGSSPVSPFHRDEEPAAEQRQPGLSAASLTMLPSASSLALLGNSRGLLSTNGVVTPSSPVVHQRDHHDDSGRISMAANQLVLLDHDKRDSWSDASSDHEGLYDQEEIITTPVKRTTTNVTPDSDWRIQALFREADPLPIKESSCYNHHHHVPVRKHSKPKSTRSDRDVQPTQRFARPSPPSPLVTRDSSWTNKSGNMLQALVRTRRNSRLQNLENIDGGVVAAGNISSFGVPGQRRRQSATFNVKKCRTSPKPTAYSLQPHRHSSPTTIPLLNNHDDDHEDHAHANNPNVPPASNSKNKMRNVSLLDLPAGVKLEERLGSAASSIRSASNIATGGDSMTASSLNSCRIISCRFRSTTILFCLVIFGLATLGRNAMWAIRTLAPLTSRSKEPMPDQSQALVPVSRRYNNNVGKQTAMGGLRGSLLLSAVGRTDKQALPKPSTTSVEIKPATTVAKVSKAIKRNKNKKKPKKQHDKDKHNSHGKKKSYTHTNDEDESRDEHLVAIKAQKSSRFFYPPATRLGDDTVTFTSPEGRAFDDQDPMMYALEPTDNVMSSSYRKRVFMFHEQSSKQPSSREVDQFPAEFTDNTQFYSVYDSDDERLRKMELREPYSQGECVPMQDWQTTFHPSCNGVHELGVEYLGEEGEDKFSLFGTKGYWRYAWRLDLGSGGKNHEDGDTVVLKTLKFKHDFEDAYFEHDRIDAVAMERLTASPHVINVFGFCGHSVLTEYANGPRLGELADKSRSKPLARLKIARDIANGLADVHGIDRKDGKNTTFVHLDINPANVVSIGGTLKLNDFNIGIIRRWNTTSQTPCGFPAQYPNPQWRSPEEARGENGLTEKVDVFSMGHIFFRLICGHEPWNKLELGGKPSKDEINEKVQKGILPTIPDTVMNSDDEEVASIRDAMLQCYNANPEQRPSARDIAQRLEAVLEKLAALQVSIESK